jgi:hypothetical protein
VAEAIRAEATSPRIPVVVGELVRVTCVFTSLDDGAAYDPATVTFITREPDGDIVKLVYGTDAAVQRDSAGLFHIDLTVATAGVWRYRWESGADMIGIAEGQITVTASGVGD